MEPLGGWTGRTASALQAALRLSNEAFAQRLGVGVRTVAAWHQKPTLRPRSEMQQVLDTALEQATPAEKQRYAQLSGAIEPPQLPDALFPTVAPEAEHRLRTDRHIGAALDWLDQQAGWAPNAARQEVASRLQHLDMRALLARGGTRSHVQQRQIAEALGHYYGNRTGGHGRYVGQLNTDGDAPTSILTHCEWLDLDCPLIAGNDRFSIGRSTSADHVQLNEQTAISAAQRIAETLALGIRFIDMPLYSLTDIDTEARGISGTFGMSSFIEYAFTMDLLEGELIDALASESPPHLPLRDRYLPDISTVLNLADRLCAGGVLVLTAIARPSHPFSVGDDYVLLVQERSGSVLNAARRLAVIPKGFHQPIVDARAETHIGATLLREMEEELFGREDIDNTVAEQRSADPMHPSRLSEPMRWLLDKPDRLRLECTGIGLNLVSGNYELACLLVIDDEEFWPRYGGQIEANWEAEGLRLLSSRDHQQITELIANPAWSNEGLFALLQGLRRLRTLGSKRVDVPPIGWEIA